MHASTPVGVGAAVTAPTPGRVGRDGSLRLVFTRRGGRTVLTGCRSVQPLQVLAPLALDDRAEVVTILNPAGGVLGGDRLTIDVVATVGAHTCLTTPSATRIYRTDGPVAEQRVTLRLEPGAILEWVPEHTIPFAGAAFRQHLTADVAEGATLIAVDAFAAGRVALDEAWRFAHLESALTARDARGWIVHDRFALHGETRWADLGFTESHPYFASLLIVTDAATGSLAAEVPGTAARTGTRAAAGTLPRRGLLIRALAPTAPTLTTLLTDLWALARHHVLGLPPLALRKP